MKISVSLRFYRGLAALSCASLLTLSQSSLAVAKPGEGSKYGVVDMQAVILNVEEDLLKKKEELDKMNEEWKKQAPLLNEQARMSKQQEFQEKFMALRGDEMKFQNEIKGKEAQATQKIAVSVTKLVNDMAKQRGFEMVFEANSAGLLYLKDPVDLTKDVIAAFEEQSKKGNSAKK